MTGGRLDAFIVTVFPTRVSESAACAHGARACAAPVWQSRSPLHHGPLHVRFALVRLQRKRPSEVKRVRLALGCEERVEQLAGEPEAVSLLEDALALALPLARRLKTDAELSAQHEHEFLRRALLVV